MLVGTVAVLERPALEVKALVMAHHGVLGVHAVAEEEAQVGREGVDVHAQAQ